jgi:hypothetical protein
MAAVLGRLAVLEVVVAVREIVHLRLVLALLVKDTLAVHQEQHQLKVLEAVVAVQGLLD